MTSTLRAVQNQTQSVQLQHIGSDFLWGAATSAFQTEGSLEADGRGRCVWQDFAAVDGHIADGSDGSRACDSYRRWQRDVELVAHLGAGAYRMSLSWARIMPDGVRQARHANSVALDHYEAIVDALLERGVRPIITLNHWDMPSALMQEGGWASRSTVDAFASYASAVGKRLGDRVHWWVTHNEPWVVQLLGYHLGLHAPGLRDLRAALSAAHHMLLSHGMSSEILLAMNPDAQVSCALSLYPCDPASSLPSDQQAAWGSDGYVNRWFLDPLFRSGYPDDMRCHWEYAVGDLSEVIHDGDEEMMCNRSQWIAVNYYTRRLLRAAPSNLAAGRPFPWEVIQPSTQVPRSALGWEIVPRSLTALLVRLSQDYPGVPMMVTENGIACSDVVTHDGRIHDRSRIMFLREHLAAIDDAVAQGAPVIGYLHWSLIDNFEWAMGYGPRFGLVHMDYATGEHRLKDSYDWYASVIGSGVLAPVPDHTMNYG